MRRCLWCDSPIDRWDFCSEICGSEWRNAKVELDRSLSPEEHELRKQARAAVRRALDLGELTKGECEHDESDDFPECEGVVDAHHDDYSKPLEVRWLCRRHHQQEHREMRALKLRRSDPKPQPPEAR